MSERPNRQTGDEELWKYIEHLESIIAGYNDNGAIQFMAALNRKLKEIADQINFTEINFNSKDDKMYERFLSTVKAGMSIMSDMKLFTNEYGDQIKEDDKRVKNLMEERARNRGKNI